MTEYLLTNNEEITSLTEALKNKYLIPESQNFFIPISFHSFGEDYLNHTLKVIPSNNLYHSIYSYAFYNQSCLQEATFLSCSIVDNNAFENCINLSKITLKNTIYYLDSGTGEPILEPAPVQICGEAFLNCINLHTVYLYSYSFYWGGWGAFSNCYNLRSVYLYQAASNIESNTFKNTPLDVEYVAANNISHGTVYVLSEYYNNYLTYTNWCLLGQAGYISIMED